MQNIFDQIRVKVAKRGNSERKRAYEIRLEVPAKCFQGTDWLESLGRLSGLENYLSVSIRDMVTEYVKSAEEQLLSFNKEEVETNSSRSGGGNVS